MITEYLVRPLPGESHCGDAVVVRREEGMELLAVIDGLGHGIRAENATRQGVAVLQETSLARGTTAVDLIERLHSGLRGTRGAAAMLCVWDGRTLDCCGVGNVELRASGTQVPALLTPGILGHQHHRLRPFAAELSEGTRVAVFTDGVSSRFDMRSVHQMRLHEACKHLIDEHARHHDDAAVTLTDFVS